LITWWGGAVIAALRLEPVAIHTFVITGCCALLAWRHQRDWRRTGSVSLLLQTEARHARIDALITLATGLALLVSPLLLGTPLSVLASITDPLLVLLVSLVLLREPWTALRQEMDQAAGCSADQDVLECTRAVFMQQLVGLQLQMMDFTVQQLGRTAFVVVYINPVQPQDGFGIDGLRHQIDQRCSSALGRPVRSEVILTVNPPINHLNPTPQAAP
jgi:predicted Co/Zn/Cd cation transporter (cation efflux family)